MDPDGGGRQGTWTTDDPDRIDDGPKWRTRDLDDLDGRSAMDLDRGWMTDDQDRGSAMDLDGGRRGIWTWTDDLDRRIGNGP